MLVNLAFLVIVFVTTVRTLVYGLYCFKNSGVLSGISVMFLFICILASGVTVILKIN